ncbi:hypothetical protein IQ250_10555 [Pseudanabaenaceae cyanobacterium LEGE 13415]|nr:hypothetical protein [Pseudanabaenaceae cyanobacterium LEGE 13415]
MSATDLFSTLRGLSREDKLKVMEFLSRELETEETQDIAPLQAGATYHIWSPFNSHGAAQVLADLLETSEQND